MSIRNSVGGLLSLHEVSPGPATVSGGAHIPLCGMHAINHKAGSHGTDFVPWVLRWRRPVLRSGGVARPSPANVRADLLRYRQSAPSPRSPFGGRIQASGGCPGSIAPETGLFAFRIRADAGSLARASLAGFSPHHFPRGSGCQMDFGALPQPWTARFEACLAASVLGPLCPPCSGVPRKAGLYALESGAKRLGQAAGRLDVVEL